MKKQKKIALINDFSGFGRCSLSVSIPILSYMKICCCSLPTAVFSNHTGFSSYAWKDLSDQMPAFMWEWEKLQLEFDGIYTGFLGSLEQISTVESFIDTFRRPQTVVIVDPVMGDDGKIYPTYTEEMCQAMKRLASRADILTPNITEACLLTDTPYQEEWNQEELQILGNQLLELGCRKAVITGIEQDDHIVSCIIRKHKPISLVTVRKIARSRPGTGDVFASVIAGNALRGISFRSSVKMASRFVRDCLKVSDEMEIPLLEGVAFEEILDELDEPA